MDRIIVRGGRRLEGTVPVAGAKNAALPLMCASLLTDRPVTLRNVPHLADIATLAGLLGHLGVAVGFDGHDPGGGHAGRVMTLSAGRIADTTAPYDMVRKMRASVLVLGPLVARCGAAKVSLPGGCAIGTRPVDLHVKALQALGAEVTLEGGYIHARAPAGLRAGEIVFPLVSVGATETALLAAAATEGTTRIVNAAREPEVQDLCRLLVAMGARIEGIGTAALSVEGRAALGGAVHDIVPDRIEAGTFAIAAAITGGDLTLAGASADDLRTLASTLKATGATVEAVAAGLRVVGPARPRGVDVMTEPFPGFPTDLQAQYMALMCVAEGASMITETIFENRFMHVPELARMGARITVHGGTALVRGVAGLRGAPVMATDLRASVSLVLAGLAAEGETVVNRVYHLDRGYEHLEAKLAAVGAEIVRMREAA
jgi:UDP-N-acetylglucosamine 1-carboxyvinyltransferase